MTEVCIVAGEDVEDLRSALLGYETARDALSTYALRTPYANALVVDTISLGAAVSMLNDLDWYLRRLARDALVREPSVDGEEWLSRALATAIRDGEVDPEAAADRLKVYGVVETDGAAGGRLVEPMYVARTASGGVPAYDLRDVADTVVVRVTADEFR